MTSQPATPSLNLGPDRIFGPFDQDLAHRAAQLSPTKAPTQPVVFPPAAHDAAPSYCAWPAKLVDGS